MERIYSSRWFHLIAALVITAAILVAYSNTFHAAFQFDDIPQVVENGVIKNLSNLTGILKLPRPVSFLSFALNYAWGGLDVFGYHLVNTFIHILASVSAYFLIYTLLMTTGAERVWSSRIAVFSALLFALHPVQTQAVTYIVQRMESLASLFFILSLLFFVLAVRASSPFKRYFLYSGTVVAYILGFYSKESAITVPAVIVLADFFFICGRGLKGVVSRLPLYAVLFVLLGYFAFVTIKPLGGLGDLGRPSSVTAGAHTTGQPQAQAPQRDVQPVFEGPSAGFSQTAITPKEYLYTQFNVLVYYTALLAVPVNQNLDYDFPVAKSLFKAPAVNSGTVLNLPVWPPIVSLLLILCVIGIALYMFLRAGASAGVQKGLVASFFIFWFFIILAPTSSFVPIIDVIYEHRLYLAALGPFTIFVICVDAIVSRLLGCKAQ